jgi:DNA-binding winged helix-turn-helix (wHTH) protein
MGGIMAAVELFRLHCKLFDLNLASELSSSFSAMYHDYQDKHDWAIAVTGLLRVYNQLNETTRREQIYFNSVDLHKNGVVCSSLFYVLGRSHFEKSQLKEAVDFFEKAIDTATSVQQKNLAIIGLVNSEFYRNEFHKSLELLSLIVEIEPDLELQICKLMLSAQCRLSLKQFDLSQQFLSLAKKLCQQDRNFYLFTQVILVEIEMNNLRSNFDKSASLIKFVKSLMPTGLSCKTVERLNYFEDQLNQKKTRIGFELIESESLVKLTRPDQQCVNITKHPQMLQLLRKLTQAQGKQISKEEICHILWNREYHSLEMDNKIYVAVKRLRKLIQDDSSQPKYILKKENGYCWNSEVQFTWFHYKHFVDLAELS